MPQTDRHVSARIETYNAGREPERLALKFGRMAADPFTFFRGTCHLFYEDLPRDAHLFQNAPAAWVCGDLHLENFGSYKGDNGLAYFDINDFDEGGLAPVTWELARFLTSLWLAAGQIGVSEKQGTALERAFLDAYVASLSEGKARWVERDTAEGMVRELLGSLQTRNSFLRSRTDLKRGGRRLKLEPGRTLPIPDAERRSLIRWMEAFASSQPSPAFFDPLDVARRVAGNGSLGLRRYVLLVEGKGSPDGNVLLDLKQALPSALEPYFSIPQPSWESSPARVVAIQKRMQAITPALMRAIDFGGEGWILRELQPSKDRLRLSAWDGQLRRLERVLRTMGELLAWAQIRSSGRQGSATTDELMAFARRSDWRDPLMDYATAYSRTVKEDWRSFRRALET